VPLPGLSLTGCAVSDTRNQASIRIA
jgi:hypothetical protein